MTSRAAQATRWLPLAVLATAQFLVVLSTSIVNVALPQIRTGLALSPAGLSWVVNTYVLVFGALLLLGGLLTGLYGWQSVFFVMAPIAVAVMVATWVLVAADQPRGGSLDGPGVLTVTGGLVALTYGLSNASWFHRGHRTGLARCVRCAATAGGKPARAWPAA